MKLKSRITQIIPSAIISLSIVFGGSAQAQDTASKLQMNIPVPSVRGSDCNDVYPAKVLPDPWFADLYAQFGWQSIGDTAYTDMYGRVGADILPDERLIAYGFGIFTRDNRSGDLIDNFPAEYFDNLAVLGVGVQSRLLKSQPLYFLAETGWSNDLVDNDDEEQDQYTRAGLLYYKEWNMQRECLGKVHYPGRFVMTTSASSLYYSRYDDAWITNIDLRPGFRLIESDYSSLDASLVLNAHFDSKANENLDYHQVGVALTWVPDAHYGFKLVGEALNTYYDEGDEDAENEYNTNLYLVYERYF